MAVIREYTSPDQASGGVPARQAQASDMGGGTGLEDVGASVGKVGDALYDLAQRDEVADVYTQLSAKRAQWTVELQRRASSPQSGDPDFASKVTQDFGNDMAGMGDNISTVGGRLALQRGQAELTSQIVSQAGAYQIKAAGDKAVNDYKVFVDNNRTAVYNNPSSFESANRDVVAAINDPNGPYSTMPAAARTALQREATENIALSAVQGTIRTNPQQGLDELNSGKWDQFLTGDKRNTAETFGLRAQRAQEYEQARLDAQAQKAQKAEWDQIGTGFLKQLNSTDPSTPALSTKDVLYGAGKDMPPALQEHWLSMINRADKPDPLSAISHATSTSMFQDIHLPDGDPNKIVDEKQIDQAYINGNLNRTDLDFLRKEVGSARTDDGERLGKRQADFLSGYKAQITKSNPLMGNLDKEGDANFYMFQRNADSMVQQYRQAGKNPYDLFDPSKPDYLGKPEALQGFQKTMQQSMVTIKQNINRGSAAQRQPGESIDAYLARTKAK